MNQSMGAKFNLAGPPLAPSARAAAEEIDARDLFRILRRYRLHIALWIIALVGAATAYLAVTPSQYTASAQIILEPRIAASAASGGFAAPATLTSAQADSEVQVLKSQEVLRYAFQSRLLDPEFSAPAPDVLRTALAATLQRLGLARFKPAADAALPEDVAFARFADRVDVRRVGESYVIEISFWSQNPETAARATNAIASAYIRNKIETESGDARSGDEWLAARATSRDAQLKTAEAAMRDGSVPAEPLAAAHARIISPATVPFAKSYPRPSLTVAFAATFGLLTGLLGVAIAHHFDDRLYSGADIRRRFGDLHAIDLTRERRGGWNLPAEDVLSADAGNEVRAAILCAPALGKLGAVGFLSAEQGAVRSAIASSAAFSLASAGMTTVLLDCDCDSEALTRRFAAAQSVGQEAAPAKGTVVADAAEGVTINERLRFVPTSALSFIGRVGRGFAATESTLAAIGRTKSVAHVLVDLPAMAQSSDASVLASALDAVFVVAVAGQTTGAAATEILRRLRAFDVPVLGVILADARSPWARLPPENRKGRS